MATVAFARRMRSSFSRKRATRSGGDHGHGGNHGHHGGGYGDHHPGRPHGWQAPGDSMPFVVGRNWAWRITCFGGTLGACSIPFIVVYNKHHPQTGIKLHHDQLFTGWHSKLG